MTRPDPLDYPAWLQANPSPDLLELVTRHGGYGHIPREAWADFQAASDDWETRRRERLAGGPRSPVRKKSTTAKGKNVR